MLNEDIKIGDRILLKEYGSNIKKGYVVLNIERGFYIVKDVESNEEFPIRPSSAESITKIPTS